MNTREIAAEYRLSHWAGILRERKESGLSIRAYCEQAGFHENVYYYWQRKLREAACEELAQREALQPAAPEGWALCTTEGSTSKSVANEKEASGDQLIVEAGGVRLTVGSEYPPEKLASLIRELMRSC